MHVTVLSSGLKAQFETIAKDKLKKPQLQALLKSFQQDLKSLKARYQAVCEGIAATLATGRPRRYGKPKLDLSVEQLSAYMAQVDERAVLTNAARIVVPLYRRLRILVDQETRASHLPQTTRVLMRRNKAEWLADVFVVAQGLAYQTPALAQALLAELTKAHPEIFPEFRVPATLGAMRATAEAAQKDALYEKVTQGMTLSPAEQRLLAKALSVQYR